MIELFRRNLFINSLLLLPICALLRIKSLLYPTTVTIESHHGYVNKLIYNTIYGGFGQSLVAIILIFLQAMMINRIIIKNNISKEITLITGLLFVTLNALSDSFLTFHPIIIANTFIILGFAQLFRTYNNTNVASEIYLTGFYTSMASLFYFPYLILIIFTNLSLMIMRSYKTKEKIQHILGWMSPYYLIFAWQYWTQSDDPIIPNYFKDQISLTLSKGLVNLENIILIALCIIGAFFFIININNYYKKTANAIQKRISILYWLMLFSAIIPIFYKHIGIVHILFYLIPASYFFAIKLLQVKNRLVQELTYLFIIILIVISQSNIFQLS